MISEALQKLRSTGFYIACVVVGISGTVHAQQTGEKLVRVNQISHIKDAVLISNVAVGGKTVECGLFVKPPHVIQPVTPFQAGSDWLQHMTISLINRTNKAIVAGGIMFHFLDTGDCRSVPCAATELHFGRLPDIDAYDGRTGKPFRPQHSEQQHLDWKPGQTLVIHVSDYMTQIEHTLANFLPVTYITNVTIYRGAFYFRDGMMWDPLGWFSIPDPGHPGKFNRLPYRYFPGKQGHNWPPGYNQ